jgi:hypothetical protein
MGEVVRFKRPKPAEQHRGKTLCRSGFHRWKLERDQQFDVKQGRLVTVYRCTRCGALKNEAR